MEDEGDDNDDDFNPHYTTGMSQLKAIKPVEAASVNRGI